MPGSEDDVERRMPGEPSTDPSADAEDVEVHDEATQADPAPEVETTSKPAIASPKATAAKTAAAKTTAAKTTPAKTTPAKTEPPPSADASPTEPPPPPDPPARELPPTLICDIEENDDGPPPLASVPTRTLGLPQTVITSPIDEPIPGESTMRLPPARRTRPSALEIVARVVVGAAMALGVFVIVAHLATSGAAATNGPLRVIADAAPASTSTPTGVAVRARQVDPTTRLDTLEREAAQHLASGRLEEASAVYATLAALAPHQRAYALAARILAEKAAEP